MKFYFEGAEFVAEPSETVLQALLRQGAAVPYSCGKGICQACLLRSDSGRPPAKAQQGLRDTLREQNYFLACQCEASAGMAIHLPASGAVYTPAVVSAKEMLTRDLCRIWLAPDQPWPYRAGQFLNLRRADGEVRSYSLASVSGVDAHLELHVQRRQEGVISQWILDQLQIGMSVEIQGPNGNCFYLPGREQEGMLMIGTGTGLAPLLGIARDALRQGHAGPIFLYHGSRNAAGFYGRDLLDAMAARHDNLHVQYCATEEMPAEDYAQGRACEIAFARHANLQGFRVYLCGAPAMVNHARKTAYLNGARMQDIHADPFENRELRRLQRG